jgi:SAM-dependent methyltransferase
VKSNVSSSSLRTVPETRFGVWFQSSRLCNQYVLTPALEELVQLANGLIPVGPVVFDAGCGHGAGLEWMATRLRPSRIHAVDGDARLIKEARARASRLPMQSDVRRGELGRIDLDDASVDVVICHQTLHHVTDQDGALREFRRVLRPGGVLLLAESCWPFLRKLPVKLFFRHPPSARRVARDYLSRLDRHGFEVERRRTAFPRPFWTLMRHGKELDAETAPLCHVAAVRRPSKEGDYAERLALRVSTTDRQEQR